MAHRFFADVAAEWIADDGEEQIGTRAEVLERTVRELLQVVVIDLTTEENAQEIFETLNSRGAQLSAADLIKNFVFQRLQEEGADTEASYESYWKQFETAFWEREIQAGRFVAPRSSWFLNHFLIARLGQPVTTQEVFTRFKTYALHESGVSMMELVRQIHRAAIVYERFAVGVGRSDSSLSALELFAYRTQVMDSDVASITYADLAKAAVQEASGIRTGSAFRNWIGRVLGSVARHPDRPDEPMLTSLVVHADGTIGPGYAEPVAERDGAVPEDLELHAAAERHACYRYFGAEMPPDGGRPMLTRQVAERHRARASTRTTPRPICPTCFIQLPASGLCDRCDDR